VFPEVAEKTYRRNGRTLGASALAGRVVRLMVGVAYRTAAIM
jgi:hypothetical protein